MSKEKGFKRLTLVLSILSGLICSIVCFITADYLSDFWNNVIYFSLTFAVGFASIWILYAFIKFVVIGFIIKGFKND